MRSGRFGHFRGEIILQSEPVRHLIIDALKKQGDDHRLVLADFDPTDVVLQGDFDMEAVGATVTARLRSPDCFRMTPELRTVLPGVTSYRNLVEVYRALVDAAEFLGPNMVGVKLDGVVHVTA